MCACALSLGASFFSWRSKIDRTAALSWLQPFRAFGHAKTYGHEYWMHAPIVNTLNQNQNYHLKQKSKSQQKRTTQQAMQLQVTAPHLTCSGQTPFPHRTRQRHRPSNHQPQTRLHSANNVHTIQLFSHTTNDPQINAQTQHTPRLPRCT